METIALNLRPPLLRGAHFSLQMTVNFAFCPQMRDLPAMVQSWFDNFNTSDAMMWF